jgi:ADP-heptose:LPS heptosyltransferase
VKILLAKRRALGDTVLLSSAVELLARAIPGAEISALVPAPFAPVLENNPSLHRIHTFEESWLSLVPKLRAQKFDHFFQLHASPRTRWLAWAAGAKKTHFHYQNKETERAYGKHPGALEWDAFHFRAVLGENINPPAPMPKIYLSDVERAEGREIWRRQGVDPAKIIYLGLGASRLTKRWLPSHFARLSEVIRDRLEGVPGFVVGPGEEEALFAARVIDELRARGMRPLGKSGDFVHLAGLPVRELAKALSAVRAYVGNDSGPKHMAVALGVPTFTIFGPEDPVEWHPYPRHDHPIFFLPALGCRKEDQGRWCGIAVCEVENHRCMRDIDPLDVFEAMAKRIKA